LSLTPLNTAPLFTQNPDFENNFASATQGVVFLWFFEARRKNECVLPDMHKTQMSHGWFTFPVGILHGNRLSGNRRRGMQFAKWNSLEQRLVLQKTPGPVGQ